MGIGGLGSWGWWGWGVGIGDLAQPPNPQSPIPNPQSPIPFYIKLYIIIRKNKRIYNYLIELINIKI